MYVSRLKDHLAKQRYGVNRQMKRLSFLIPLLLAGSHYASAANMTGFARQYYQDDASLPEAPTKIPLFPKITIGNKTIHMEKTLLSEIATTPVEKDNSARWLCLHTDEGTNYWFISDNEMGAGLLTAVAISNDGNHQACMASKEPIRISIPGVPLLDATRPQLNSLFSNTDVLNKLAVLFYQETPAKNGFVQSNTVSYYFSGETLRGVIVGQITSN